MPRRGPTPTQWIALAVFVVLLFLPLGVGAYPMRVATVIFMWAALAGSWNLLAGYAGAVDLGPVVYYGLGAFVTAALMLKASLPFLVSVVLAGVVAMGIAYAAPTSPSALSPSRSRPNSSRWPGTASPEFPSRGGAPASRCH